MLAETCQHLEEGYKSRKLWKASGCQEQSPAESRSQTGATGAEGPPSPHLWQAWKAKSRFWEGVPICSWGGGSWRLRREGVCLLPAAGRVLEASSDKRPAQGKEPQVWRASKYVPGSFPSLFPSSSGHVLRLQPESVQIYGAPAGSG